jgi:hypothetical protein
MNTQQELKQLFSYLPETGEFRWLNSIRNGAIKQGDIAGSTNNDGYTMIKVRGRTYPAHRLAWLYVYGSQPSSGIDHINGIRIDNRIANLRLATVKQNNENTSIRKDNKTGCRGVHFSAREGKYVAKMEHNKRRIPIGYFDRLEDAAIAVQKMRTELYTHDVGRAALKELNHD